MKAFCRYNKNSMYRYDKHAFGCENVVPGIWFLPYTADTPIPNSTIEYRNGGVLTAMCLYAPSHFLLQRSNYTGGVIKTFHALVGSNVTPNNNETYYVGGYGRVFDSNTEILDVKGIEDTVTTKYGVMMEGDVDDSCSYSIVGKNDIVSNLQLNEMQPYYDPANTFLFNGDYVLIMESNDYATYTVIVYRSQPEPDNYVTFMFKNGGYSLDSSQPITYHDFIFDFYCHSGTTLKPYKLNVMTGEVYQDGILIENIYTVDSNTELRFFNSRGNNAIKQLEQCDNQDYAIDCSSVEIVSIDCHKGYDANGEIYILDSPVYKPGKYWFKEMKLLADANGWYHIGYYSQYNSSVVQDNFVVPMYMDINYELYNKNVSHRYYGYVEDMFDLDGNYVYPINAPAPNFDTSLFNNNGLRDINYEFGIDPFGNRVKTYGEISGAASNTFKFVFDKEAIEYGISNDSY